MKDGLKKSFALLTLYDALIATQPGLLRKGANMPYTSVNGNMFSFLSEGGLVLRLPKDERENFLSVHAATLHEAHGTVLKEYVTVPEELLRRPDELASCFAQSYAYAKALKAKPTKKKFG